MGGHFSIQTTKGLVMQGDCSIDIFNSSIYRVTIFDRRFLFKNALVEKS